MIIVVAGVSGTGKSTVGQALGKQLSLPFIDADDFHPEVNKAKMQSGIPLTDDDRWPWLQTLAGELARYEQQKGVVLACSALKESYRKVLSANDTLPIAWVVLTGSYALLSARLSARENHFFDGSLLENQLQTFEMPNYGLKVDVSATLVDIIKDATAYVHSASL
ncbi:gluconokinase [Alteromonas sp. CI.11.F.A3]|uniref:gluconokinase n=1 Tax=Alteromonas sp. CI.11.F.A3 TaxID=3079555 RepID=UPI0029428471|nr:gluconokinase [Alteromonas sp. CI.11.F.A3]WOI35993.1 gluconokinase [Alteromonas sp. CI.11.F.A3]